VAIAAERIGRRLEHFAKPLLTCLGTHPHDIPEDLEDHLKYMCWRISHYPQMDLDNALMTMSDSAREFYISTEEQATRQAVYDQVEIDVCQYREEIAAIQPDQPSNIASSVTHNPEASFGQSLTIDYSFSCFKVCAKRQRRYRYGHVRVDQRGRRRCLFNSFPIGKHNDFELWFPVDFDLTPQVATDLLMRHTSRLE
jgi:hypothetical protein